MSENHCTPRIAPPFSIESLGNTVRYTGAKENLIAGGIADESMFPQGKKRLAWRCGPNVAPKIAFHTRKLRGGLYCIERPAETLPSHLQAGPRLAVDKPKNLFAHLSHADYFALLEFMRNGGELGEFHVCGAPVYYSAREVQS